MSIMKKYTRKLKKKINKKKMKMEEIDVMELKKIRNRARLITDTRIKKKTTYKIWDIIICVIISNFAEVYDWDDISLFVNEHYKWFRSFLQMTGGVPTGQTYENVLAIVDHKELENILDDGWTQVTTKWDINNRKEFALNIAGDKWKEYYFKKIEWPDLTSQQYLRGGYKYF